MKRFFLAALLVMLFAAPCFAGTEVRGFLNYYSPTNSGWNSGYGLEGQYVYWQTKELGFAGSVGISSWGAGYGDSASLIPIGASVIYRPKLDLNIRPVTLEFDGGVRYVINTWSYSHNWSDGLGDSWSIKEEAGNGIVGIIGVNGEVPIQKNLSFVGGLGLQFDISKGKDKETVTAHGTYASVYDYSGSWGDIPLGALILRFGLKMDF